MNKKEFTELSREDVDLIRRGLFREKSHLMAFVRSEKETNPFVEWAKEDIENIDKMLVYFEINQDKAEWLYKNGTSKHPKRHTHYEIEKFQKDG